MGTGDYNRARAAVEELRNARGMQPTITDLMAAIKSGNIQLSVQISELATQLQEDSWRTHEMLYDIREDQLKALNYMDKNFRNLERRLLRSQQSMDATFRLIVNLQKSDVPMLVLMKPDPKKGRGFVAVGSWFWHETLCTTFRPDGCPGVL